MQPTVRVAVLFFFFSILAPPQMTAVEPFSPPISYEEATRRADEILAALSVDEKIALLRPPKELKGFSKQMLSASETRGVRTTLDTRVFSFWHEDREQWIAEPGRYEILGGPSSADIRLRGSVELVEEQTRDSRCKQRGVR